MEKLLTAMQVVRCSKQGLYSDGGGLYLQVTIGVDGSPRKSWIFRYSIHSHARHMGLGALPQVSLADARAARDKARSLIRSGIDPIDARHIPTGINTPTFDECAAVYIKAHAPAWRNAKHRHQWPATLAAHASPVFGKLPVSAVDTGRVMRVLEPLWTSRPETARRVRGRIESVLDWAKARGYRQGENPARWRGHLAQLLPEPRKILPVRHMAALPYVEIPALMARLSEFDAMPARALRFAILTAARTGEVIGAVWSEIDLTTKVWTVPAARMKAGREHRIPLSAPAVAILMKLPTRTGYVFPGARAARVSAGGMMSLLRGMGVGGMVHGMRSSFRDWVGDETSFPREVVEAALAHAVGSAVETAYRRADALEKRRGLMEAWGAFVVQS